MDTYRPTTSSADYESWSWFQDYLRFVKQRRLGRISAGINVGPLPLAVGIEFAEWVLGNPEDRDLVYRRFVQSQYSEFRESNLLDFAVKYFCYKTDLNLGATSALTICFRPIGSVLAREISSPASEEYRKKLLESAWAFCG